MKVKNILTLACNFTDNEKLIENEETEKMLECFNLVRSEVACEYMPICESEEFEIKDFKLLLSNFKRKPLQILSVKDRFGRNLRFKVFPEYLIVYGSKAKITYTVQPEKVGAEDEIEDSLPERVYAYGVAREYLMREGMFEDAEIFEVRFKNSLKVLLHKRSETVLPRRRWL